VTPPKPQPPNLSQSFPATGNKCNELGDGPGTTVNLSQLFPATGNRCNEFGVGVRGTP